MASVIRDAALDNVLLLGAWALGVLRAAVQDQVGCADVWVSGVVWARWRQCGQGDLRQLLKGPGLSCVFSLL